MLADWSNQELKRFYSCVGESILNNRDIIDEFQDKEEFKAVIDKLTSTNEELLKLSDKTFKLINWEEK